MSEIDNDNYLLIKMKNVRTYIDTSVFGGVFDEEFESPSKTFFDQIKAGQFILVTSAVVQEELDPAIQCRKRT